MDRNSAYVIIATVLGELGRTTDYTFELLDEVLNTVYIEDDGEDLPDDG